MKSKSGIYKITNIINNRCYIGSSVNINVRWNEHKRMLRNNKHDNNFIQKSWNKHGEESFIFEIVEVVEDVNNLLSREQYYLDDMIPFNKKITYNICVTAGNMLGFKHSNETKEKMSDGLKGNTYALGHRHSNETKEKMSKSHTGSTHKEETIYKLISLKHNRKHSDETKLKLSNINKGKKSKNTVKVYQLDLNDNIIKLWDSITIVSNELNINLSSICGVCNGRNETCGGFKWKYYEEPKRLELTNNIIYEIKEKYKTGLFSTRKLSKLYNISKSKVWNIVK